MGRAVINVCSSTVHCRPSQRRGAGGQVVVVCRRVLDSACEVSAECRRVQHCTECRAIAPSIDPSTSFSTDLTSTRRDTCPVHDVHSTEGFWWISSAELGIYDMYVVIVVVGGWRRLRRDRERELWRRRAGLAGQQSQSRPRASRTTRASAHRRHRPHVLLLTFAPSPLGRALGTRQAVSQTFFPFFAVPRDAHAPASNSTSACSPQWRISWG